MKSFKFSYYFNLTLLVSLFYSMMSLAVTKDTFFEKFGPWIKNSEFAKIIDLGQQVDLEKLTEEDRNDIKFILAYSFFEKGDLVSSKKAFQELLSIKNEIEKYVLYYYVQILEKEILQANVKPEEQESRKKELMELLSRLLKLPLNEKMKRDVLVSYSRLELANKDLKMVLTQMKKIERRSRSLEIYPSVVFSLATLYSRMKQPNLSCRWIKKLYSQYPLSTEVDNWGADLSQNLFLDKKITFCKENEKDFRQRVRILALLGHEEQAFKEIESYYKLKKDEVSFEKNKTLAVVYKQKEDIYKAIELLEAFFKDQKNNNDYLLQLANLYAKTDNTIKASSLYQMIYNKSPRSKEAQQALFNEALLNYQSENYDGSSRNFKEFVRKYGKIKQARDAQWFLGWLSYLRGDYEGSQKIFLALLKDKQYKRIRSLSKEKIEYWLAMSYLRLNQRAEAQIYFDKLSSVSNFGFYNLAAQSRLKQMSAEKKKTDELAKSEAGAEEEDDLSTQDSEEESFSAEESTGEEDSTVADDSAPTDTASSEPDSEELFPGLQKTKFVEQFHLGRKLVSLGLFDWAKLEFYEIEKKTKNKEFLRTLMMQYQSLGEYYRPFYLSQITFARQRTRGGIDGSRYLWVFAYPKAYENEVQENSKKTKVPVEFVWSIMRAESNFRYNAVSPAGALGLMQIMPFTGQKVSELIGNKNFTPSSLLVPEVNIQLGTRYLQRLLNQFNESTALAAAAYNGGPHRVQNWLMKFGNIDSDEFIEHIPYLETRNYVKKVLTNEYLYKNLYSSANPNLAFLSQPVQQTKVDSATVSIQFKEKWD